MPGYSAHKKTKKKEAALVDEKCSLFHVLRMNGCVSPPFMQSISIFSGISAILQPRSNTVVIHGYNHIEYSFNWKYPIINIMVTDQKYALHLHDSLVARSGRDKAKTFLRWFLRLRDRAGWSCCDLCWSCCDLCCWFMDRLRLLWIKGDHRSWACQRTQTLNMSREEQNNYICLVKAHQNKTSCEVWITTLREFFF